MRTWKSLLSATLALGFATACGDDGGTGDDTSPDAEQPDMMIDGPSAATVAATIAITDVQLTSEGATDFRGGVVAIEFSDLTMGGGQVLYGTSPPIGDCLVLRYDADGTPNALHPSLDAGAITISGDGLLKTVGPCAYGPPYTCVSDTGTGQVTGASSSTVPFITYTWPGTPFMGKDLVGSYLLMNGFNGTQFNTGAIPRPIIQQTVNTLTTLAAPSTDTTEPSTNGNFVVMNGLAPIPTSVGVPVDADFLGDETTSITVTKAADPDWPAIDFTVYPRGEGLALASTSPQPHQFPTTPAAVTFTCADATCGADADAPLEALVVSGRTTDTPVTGLRSFVMPPPTTAYTTFQCAFFSDTAAISQAAVEAILSTSPTRIETRIFSVAGGQITNPANTNNVTTIVVGHGLIGHATPL